MLASMRMSIVIGLKWWRLLFGVLCKYVHSRASIGGCFTLSKGM